MPTYQYACTECGEQLEAVQKFSDDPLTVCPVCGGRLRKVFSPVGIVFKGSGFYRNDSRKVPAEPVRTGQEDRAAASKDRRPAASGSSSGDSSGKSGKSSGCVDSGSPATGRESGVVVRRDQASGEEDGVGAAPASPSASGTKVA